MYINCCKLKKTVYILRHQRQFSHVTHMYVVLVSTLKLRQHVYYCANPVCYVVFL